MLRPEAVRAVIEVKGSMSMAETRRTLDSFHDFATRWRETQLFYMRHAQSTTPAPGMYVFAWDFKRKKNGSPSTTPARIAGAIADYYKERVDLLRADGYPFMSTLSIYNEAEISAAHDLRFTEDSSGVVDARFGWAVGRGRFVRMGSDGEPHLDRDRTIASLLAALHTKVAMTDFNRFFSYTDEVGGRQLPGFDEPDFRYAYEGLKNGTPRLLTTDIPLTPETRRSLGLDT